MGRRDATFALVFKEQGYSDMHGRSVISHGFDFSPLPSRIKDRSALQLRSCLMKSIVSMTPMPISPRVRHIPGCIVRYPSPPCVV